MVITVLTTIQQRLLAKAQREALTTNSTVEPVEIQAGTSSLVVTSP